MESGSAMNQAYCPFGNFSNCSKNCALYLANGSCSFKSLAALADTFINALILADLEVNRKRIEFKEGKNG